jgi:hypothetical protein
MRKIILAALLIISSALQAQEFDRALAKTIKTEINLNRIARSREPLTLVMTNQQRADSMNSLYYKAYKSSLTTNSRGAEVIDYEAIEATMKAEITGDRKLNYYFIIIDEEGLDEELREMMFEDVHFYNLSTSYITISVINHEGMLIITILT